MYILKIPSAQDLQIACFAQPTLRIQKLLLRIILDKQNEQILTSQQLEQVKLIDKFQCETSPKVRLLLPGK